MSIRRIGILLGKELSHGTKNFIFIFATIIPVVISLVLSLVFGRLLADKPSVGIADLGDSQLTALFAAQDYLITQPYTSNEVLQSDVESGVLDMGLIVPEGFDSAVRDGANTDITLYFWGEGLITDRATLITALAKNVIEITGRDVPVSVEPVILGDTELVSWSERLLPILVLMVIVLGGTLIPAVALVDEKQKRTLQALTITPTSLWDVLTAKALLGIGVSLAMGIIILVLNRAFGSQPLLLVLLLGLGAVAAAELGVLLGIFTRDIAGLFTIIKSMAILLYAPAIIDLIPQLPGWLAQLFPTYYIIAPIQNVALNGAGWSEIAGQVAVLGVLIAVMLVALVVLVRWKQQREAFAV